MHGVVLVLFIGYLLLKFSSQTSSIQSRKSSMDPDTSSNNGDYLPSYETATALAEQQELSSSVTALIDAPPPSYYTTVQQPAGSDNAAEDRGSSPVQSVSPPPQYSRGRRYATREEFEADIKVLSCLTACMTPHA